MAISELEPLLISGAQTLGVPLDAQQRSQLLTLIAELTDWNTRINLTAIRDPSEMLRKHLLDSLAVQPYLHGHTVADIGSGAGFPGLPLAIANPQRHFTLVESTGKKARFLQHAVTALGLGNVSIVNQRAEAWNPPQRFDTVICRALGSLQAFVRVAGHLCTTQGRLLAMKGQYPHEEISQMAPHWRVAQVHSLQVPGLDAHRHLIELARVR